MKRLILPLLLILILLTGCQSKPGSSAASTPTSDIPPVSSQEPTLPADDPQPQEKPGRRSIWRC